MNISNPILILAILLELERSEKKREKTDYPKSGHSEANYIFRGIFSQYWPFWPFLGHHWLNHGGLGDFEKKKKICPKNGQNG